MTCRWKLVLPLLAAMAAAGPLWILSSYAPPPPAPAGGDGAAALLVRFGPHDREPADWDGSVDASGGEVVSVRNWRPRPQESVDGREWKLASRWSPVFRYRSWEAEPVREGRRELHYPGLVVSVRGPSAVLRFRTKQGEFRVNAADAAFGRTRGYLDGRVTVERVPDTVRLSDDATESDFPAIARGAGSDVWAAWVAYRKGAAEVLARRFDGRAWQPAQAVSARPGDVFRVALAPGKSGRVHVVWSEQARGNFHLYGRAFDGSRWGAVERLADAPGSDIHPQTASDPSGNVWLAWQSMRDGLSSVFVRRFDGAAWSAPVRLSGSSGDAWYPAIAADGSGRVYVAWDTYEKGNYDVVYRAWNGKEWSAAAPIADTLRYEAHVSLACDRDGRLWAAWNQSGLRWGKDTGLLLRRNATSLYDGRSMAVAVLDGGEWKEPAAEIEASLPEGLRGRNDLPVLQTDGAGRVWVLFRHRFDLIPGVPITAALHGAAWESYATSYDGARWTAPVPLPSSQGRSDQRIGAAPAPAGLHVIVATDNREFQQLIHAHGDVYAGVLAAPGPASAKLALRARAIPTLTAFEPHAREAEDVARIRAYRIQSGGKTYRILRGDVHRHTEISRDGKNDGSLSDCYRYSINAASLDFLGVSDHNSQGGPDVDYINWMNQQAADAYQIAGRFAPLYGYERSLGYPNGHRNVMFAERGRPTLPIPPEEVSAKVGAKALFEYLKQRRGVSIPHTPSTNMGTDWRDNDPEVEPLVEIYQGDRTSAEHEGAPKSAIKEDVTSHAGGFRPAGFVWNAWAKGYKLGLQASSDHLSTHISYACTIAEDFSRAGLLDAMRKRHSYAATDNIILDYRIEAGGREHIQGDIADIRGPFRLRVRAIGTAPIRQIDIIRSNSYLHTRQVMAAEADFTFTDNQPLAGESYYYVRVQQVDEQMAWSSPIWVRR
jgi:hypothetical protein